MYFNQVFEPILAQNTYLIGCQETGEAIVFDPMRDIERYLDIALRESLKITAVAETHIHADYLSGLREFAERFGTLVLVSDEGTEEWKYDWVTNSKYNYKLLKSSDSFQVGNIKFEVLHTPGHTPEHISFIVSDLVGGKGSPMGIISGDFVFAGDVGRPDLLESAAGQVGTMKPSAKDLYNSLQTFKTLPIHLQLWPGHRAGSACGKSMSSVPVSTVGYEMQSNLAIKETTNEQRFIDYILYGQPSPPVYFPRMKKENRSGPKLLQKIPEPDEISAHSLAEIIAENNTAIIDTRTWEEYKAGHVHGSIFAPLNNSFNTVTGSFITPDMPIYLIIDRKQLKQAVISLIRIGLDNVAGYITPGELLFFSDNDGELIQSNEINVSKLKLLLNNDYVFLLDVREASELDEIGYIRGAYNIAYTRLHYRFNEIPSNKTIMVQCRAGSRSKYAFSFLERKGFEVTHVTGGILEWINAGNEVRHMNKTR